MDMLFFLLKYPKKFLAFGLIIYASQPASKMFLLCSYLS